MEKIFCTIFQFFKIIVKGKNKKKAQNTQVWQIDGCGGKMGTKQDWKSFQGCDSCKSLHSLYIRMFFLPKFFFLLCAKIMKLFSAPKNVAKWKSFDFANRKINHLEVSFHFLHFFKKEGNPYYKYISFLLANSLIRFPK